METKSYHIILFNRFTGKSHEIQAILSMAQFNHLRIWLRGDTDDSLESIIPQLTPELETFLLSSKIPEYATTPPL